MRKTVIAGNWKMYKTPGETSAFFQTFKPLIADPDRAQVVICPPFVSVPAAVEAARSSSIEIGAQDLFWLTEGAYTGEVSAPMLVGAGCRWVIVGHSERRQYFGETDETVFKKTVAALNAGLKPIVCIGERLEERETGITEAVLGRQFAAGIGGLEPEQFERIVIAYEPVGRSAQGRPRHRRSPRKRTALSGRGSSNVSEAAQRTGAGFSMAAA